MLLKRLSFSFILCVSYISFILSTAYAIEKPDIEQAKTYHASEITDISQYWVSEKLDGVRGYWNGTQLLTRQGHLINAPEWFTKNWPNTIIDGELWMGRAQFQTTVSCVRNKTPQKQCWQKVRFMMFDLPSHEGTFTHRISAMKNIINSTTSNYLEMIEQEHIATPEKLDEKLTQVVQQQGEGLMLHLGSAIYQIGRTTNILKLKKHQDAEAIVIAYIPGKGKYKNLMGAIQVKTQEGIVFKIGSGFTDNDRANPPAIGSTITYKYNGKTAAGIPRFARYWRKRINL